ISDNPLIACSIEVDSSETPTSTYGKWGRFIIIPEKKACPNGDIFVIYYVIYKVYITSVERGG
ncbi:hypothetical protein ABEV55_18995, partial [Aneurinibacillus thermoaerophilus]|uniref:hypothetical protein n=1 Tax=Aneurinibacillus thermoaerophilus TaxID=143495 RepID=UPI003D1D47A9